LNHVHGSHNHQSHDDFFDHAAAACGQAAGASEIVMMGDSYVSFAKGHLATHCKGSTVVNAGRGALKQRSGPAPAMFSNQQLLENATDSLAEIRTHVFGIPVFQPCGGVGGTHINFPCTFSLLASTVSYEWLHDRQSPKACAQQFF